MDTPADVTFWAFVTTVIIGATTAALGWLRRGGRPAPHEPARSIHGAAIVDSSAVAGLVDAVLQLKASHDAKVKEQAQTVKVMERQAVALEGLLEIERSRERHDERRREAEHEDAVRDLREMKRELDALKRERAGRGGGK